MYHRPISSAQRFASRKALLGALILLVAGGIAWWLAARADGDSARQVAYYQDSMHPWIKSDRPGKCTLCMMDLTPIYQGEKGFAAADEVVVLSSNNVTALNVQTEKVARQPLERTLRAAGILEADNTRKSIIGAPAPGRIDEVAIPSAGAQVERGQVLAAFYSPDLSFQTRRYIFRDRITSRDEMTAQAQPMGSSRHVARLAEGGRSHPLPAREQAADPFYNDLLSPRSGTVMERNVYDGQYVAEGDRLFVVVDCSVLWFRFDVYENQLPWLKPGQELEVIVPAVPGRIFQAAIAVIEPSFLDATRTAKVRADVENPLVGDAKDAQHLLRLGMYAEARIRAVTPDVLTVPRSAVLFPGDQAYVYLDHGDGAYEMRPVQLGRQGDTDWEILSGLDEGDRVVLSGNVLIDAQAQFVQGARPRTPPKAGPDESQPAAAPLDPEVKQALFDFLAVADGISSALAADSPATLEQHTRRLPAVLPPLAKALEDDPAWHDLVERLQASARWPETTDLPAARAAFLPFATNVVALVERLRGTEEAFRSLKVYCCPMAPKPGLWFQAKGPLRNPYYGAEMLTCGREVLPTALAPAITAEPVAAPPPATVGAAPANATSMGGHQPASAKTGAALGPRAAHYTNAADTLRLRMAHLPAARPATGGFADVRHSNDARHTGPAAPGQGSTVPAPVSPGRVQVLRGGSTP